MSADFRYTRPTTLADVLAWVGNVRLHRVLCWPPPGRSTPDDLASLNAEGQAEFELIAGVVVERANSARSLRCRERLARLLSHAQPLGGEGRVAVGEPLPLDRCLVRLPDLALLTAGAHLPVLVGEVICPDNTAREREIKLAECARYGIALVWYVDPERKEVDVYPKANAKRKKTLGTNDTLDGGDVLPGFSVPVSRIFESRAPVKKGGKKSKK